MKSIRNGGELRKLIGPLVIYGGGAMGSTFYGEVIYYIDADRVFVCDQNKEVCNKYRRYVYLQDLHKFLDANEDAIIVIAVKNENVVREIYNNIGVYYCKEKIFQYVPETRQEWENRKLKEGFFNGEQNVLLESNKKGKILLESLVREKKPFLFARWGTIEGNVVYRDAVGILTEADVIPLCNNAGVFPGTKQIIDKYIQITRHAAEQIDILCVGFWCRQIEELFGMFSSDVKLVKNAIMPPCGGDRAWMTALKGMKILVVHPFAPLREKQYLRREKLFKDPHILPEFELKTYQAVQSMGGHAVYRSWIEALEKMERDIASIDFDIALLGCGAYGMPLGAFIKEKMHKQAIHVGGQLQLLFGIKGKRWDGGPVSRLYNEYWVRPTDDLKPDNYVSVENGCYW